ncbi:MAG: 50S ribosomal protein L13 [Planctomycetes bacterium]|nr:50S ribosomal protein L13 [Planctomycetota bacterium]
MKTTLLHEKDLKPSWHLVDADGRVLGRLATRVATILMGKHKPTYTPNIDTGDFVVVVNAEKVRVTGNKYTDKQYQHFTGYPDGRRVHNFERVLHDTPEEIIRLAVKRMIPRTRLGERMILKLKVYKGADHPHVAQKPVPVAWKN